AAERGEKCCSRATSEGASSRGRFLALVGVGDSGTPTACQKTARKPTCILACFSLTKKARPEFLQRSRFPADSTPQRCITQHSNRAQGGDCERRRLRSRERNPGRRHRRSGKVVAVGAEEEAEVCQLGEIEARSPGKREREGVLDKREFGAIEFLYW